MKKTNQCNNLLRTKQLVLRISNMLKIFQPKLDKLLDTNNKELYNSLCKKMPIRLHYCTGKNYDVFICNGAARIDIPVNNYSSASFAHELLHIQLSADYGVNVGGAIKLNRNGSKYLSAVISDKLADHISNVLEHRKMFPIFIELGYDGTSFLSDYSHPVLTDENTSIFKALFKERTTFFRSIPHDALDCYIGKYIAAKGACIDAFDYFSQLSKMYTIEPELCAIMDSLISRWDKYDEKREGDPLSDTYHLIIYDFMNAMEEWLKKHI